MISKIFLIPFSKLVLVWLVIYFLIVLIHYKHVKNKKKFGNIEEIKNDKLLAQIYLDQFYITNKYYTFFVTFIYIFGIVLIFVFIRYLSINNFITISPQENVYNVLVFLLVIYLLMFVTILLYKTLLTMLCEKEVNKFYIYINQYHWIDTLFNVLEYKLGEKIFGSLYLITYRISTLEYKYPFYGLEFEVAHRFIIDDEPNYIIDNQTIINYAYLVTNYARKYEAVQQFFRILSYIFRFCYKHIHKTNKEFPYFLLFLIFIIELYNREFHYIYITLFICLLIKLKHNFIEFKNNRSASCDWYISMYFYKNDVSYEKQRAYFYSNNNINISKSFSSQWNNDLFLRLEEITDYTFNKFKDTYKPSFETKQEERRVSGMYRRFWITLTFLIINYYLIITNELMILLLFLMYLIIYTHYFTYYIDKHNIKFYLEKYKYNKKNNIIFWILIAIQGYIFWLLLLKPELIFMNTEVLLELPFNLGNIVKVYNIDEKIMYLFNYFEFYINLIDNESLNKEYIRYILRQINFKDLIDNNVRLKDVQVYVKLLVDNYYINENIYKMLAEHMNNSIVVKYYINEWYIFMRNTLLIGVVTSTLIYHKNIWIITKQISTSEGTYKLMKDICLGTMKSNLTYEMLVNVIMKIFKS